MDGQCAEGWRGKFIIPSILQLIYVTTNTNCSLAYVHMYLFKNIVTTFPLKTMLLPHFLINQGQPQTLLPVCSLHAFFSSISLPWVGLEQDLLAGRTGRLIKLVLLLHLLLGKMTPLSYTRWQESLWHTRVTKGNAIKEGDEVHCVLRLLNARKVHCLYNFVLELST